MTALLGVLAIIGVATAGAVVVDLLADVPRVAVWIARFAEGMLPSRDRGFFGMAAEAEAAAVDAAGGRRSRLSVLGLALGMVAGAFRHRLRPRILPPSVGPLPHGDWVKIALPVDFEESSISAEWVWAERVDDDVYRIDNHPLFSEVTCADDRVSAVQLDDHRPGWLEFKDLVAVGPQPEVHLWIRGRFLAERRRRRLGKKLGALGMTSAWLSPQLGKASLPDGSRGSVEDARRVLRRAHVEWELVDRLPPPYNWSYRDGLDEGSTEEISREDPG